MADSRHGADDDDVTQVLPGQDAVIVTRRDDPPDPEPHPGTQVVPPQAPTEVAPSPPADGACRASSANPGGAATSSDGGRLDRPGRAG